MCSALEANGWLADVSAILTGYLPTPEHVGVAADVVARVRKAATGSRVVVDPVMGDAPKGLYIPEDAARALRDRLLPMADDLTPNAFELGWLTGRPVDDPDALAQAAETLLSGTKAARVLATSAPISDAETGVLEVSRDRRALYPTPRREGVPHGPGDVFAALLASRLEVAVALGMLDRLIEESLGAEHLRIARTAALWTKAPRIPPAP